MDLRLSIETAFLPALVGLVALAILMAYGTRLFRAPESPGPRFLTLAACAAVLLYGWQGTGRPAIADDRALVVVLLWLGFGFTLVALVGGVRRFLARPPEVRREGLRFALALVALAGWSLFVRLVLTEGNILTDGGSGIHLVERENSGTVNVLIRQLLPASLHGFAWPAITLATILSGLASPFLFALARALGCGFAAAFMAGLMLASLPLHAALFSSDFLQGTLLTLELCALLLLRVGVVRNAPFAMAAGFSFFGALIWGRPETIILCPLAALFAWPAAREMWREPIAIEGALLLAFSAGMRLAGFPDDGSAGWEGSWKLFPYWEFLTDGTSAPWWLWTLAPLGLLPMRPFVRAVVVLGFLGGLVPVHRVPHDPTGSYMEVFRYGTTALPWIALAAASGLAWLAGRPAKWSPRGRWLSVAAIAAGGFAVAATPLLHLDFLGRRYGQRVERAAFVEAMSRVPAGCQVVAPDDTKPEDQHTGSVREMFELYFFAAKEAEASGLPMPTLVPLNEFFKKPDPLQRCTYFFQSYACFAGRFDGLPLRACAQVRERYRLRSVWSLTAPFFHHRLISRPYVREAPWYSPSQTLELFEVLPK